MRRLLTTILGTAAISFSLNAVASKPATLKFSNFAGPTSFLTTGIFEPLIENIKNDSNGTLNIKLYSGGTLVKPEDAFEAVRKGLVDMAWSLTGYNPGRFKAGGVTEVPFKANNAVEGSFGVWSLYEKGLMDGFDDVYVFGLGSSGVASLHSTKKIDNANELKGDRIRAAGPMISSSLEALDFVPVGIPASQVAENLTKKVVAGSANDWITLNTWQVADLVNYHIDIPLGAATAYIVINKKKFERLPQEAKDALIKNGGKNFADFWSSRIDAENQRIKNDILSHDNQVLISPSEAELNSYKQQVQKVVDVWLSKVPNGEQVWQEYSDSIEQTRSQKNPS